MFDSVVLPAPFSPSSACTSPAAASKSTCSFATTAENRFVMPRSSTEGGGGGVCAPPPKLSALGATDHALDEPVHGIEILDRQALALLHAQLALLIVERTRELIELAAQKRRLLRGDLRLRRLRDLLAVRRQADEAVLEAPVVEARLPRAVHRGLHAPQVVRPPVVDRRGQPRGAGEAPRVRVVTDPWKALRLRDLPGRRRVDVLAED